MDKNKQMFKIALTSRYHSDNSFYFIRKSYIDWLSQDFIIQPVLPRKNKNYDDIVSECDLLMIIGGDDVHPSLYDQTLHFYTHLEDKNIEQMDFDLLKAFYNKNKPIIGICRGIQVINVYFRGDLIQHMDDYHTTIKHKKDIHRVIIDNTTQLGKYFPASLVVNSFHHQCVKNIAPMFFISAISEDGFIEAIEYKNIVGVQWHPEKMDETHQQSFIHLIKELILKDNHKL